MVGDPLSTRRHHESSLASAARSTGTTVHFVRRIPAARGTLKAQGWDVKNPTQAGAQETYLPDGWEQDQEDGHPILIKGHPSHRPVRRRVAGWGLTDDSKRIIVAALRNRIRARSLQFIPAAYKSESHLLVDEPHVQVDGAVAEATLDQLKREGVITEVEWGIYRLTEKGHREAQRLIDEAGA